jgi:esterase/lipase superfamily enzyme
MRRLIEILIACSALLLAATPVAAAPPTLVEIIEALRQKDVDTLSAAANDEAGIQSLAAIDPEAAVTLLLDIADGLESAKEFGSARATANRAVELAERTWGVGSLELVEPLRRRAAMYRRAAISTTNVTTGDRPKSFWLTLAVNDLKRAKAIVAATAGNNAVGYADLDVALRDIPVSPEQSFGTFSVEPVLPASPPVANFGVPPASSPQAVVSDLVEIFYATERARTGQRGAVRFYGFRRGPLEYGRAEISVPRDRKIGTLRTPSIWTLDIIESEERHFILKSVEPMSGATAFFQAVSSRVAVSDRKEVFVFIHGFNTTFEDAALRTAQMASDLRLDGAPILWSWPSRGAVLGYWNDAKEAESEVEAAALEAFLRDVVARTGATRIHLVSHSMGARPLLAALKRIGNPPEGVAPPFEEIVLAAPDIGIKPFDDVWPSVAGLGRRFTLYASARDKALALSRRINGMQMVGDASPIVTKPGLQSVDTTDASGGLLGHSDFAGTALDDFRGIIWLSLAPDSRCVLTAEPEQVRWWKFGGACPVEEFRQAAERARKVGGVAQALAEVTTEQTAVSDPSKLSTLQKLKNRLLEMGANVANSQRETESTD